MPLPVTLADSEDIFAWRNDSVTRRMSHFMDTVSWNEHSAWFAAALTDTKRSLLICTMKETRDKLAVVRFDLLDQAARVPINFNPAWRGAGLAMPCLRCALVVFHQTHRAVSELHAEIKVHNGASIGIFEALGFTRQRKFDGTAFYQHTL